MNIFHCLKFETPLYEFFLHRKKGEEWNVYQISLIILFSIIANIYIDIQKFIPNIQLKKRGNVHSENNCLKKRHVM